MPEQTEQTEQTDEQKIERLLDDTEDAARVLREELAERRRLREKHQAIEQLPSLINISSEKWGNARVFLDELIAELRANRASDDDPEDNAAASDSNRD